MGAEKWSHSWTGTQGQGGLFNGKIMSCSMLIGIVEYNRTHEDAKRKVRLEGIKGGAARAQVEGVALGVIHLWEQGKS